MCAGEDMDQSEENLPAMLVTDLNHNFERLVLTYQDQLYAFVLSRIRSPQAAEEIVQAALERAYFALKKYPPQRILVLKLEPWLYEITRNVFYNYTRDNHTRAKISPVPLDLSEDSPLFDIQDQSMEPDEEVNRREERQQLEHSIAALPALYQEAMRLYYFDNLNYREIAERLHQPIGTVKANVHRGTRLLRKALQGAYKGGKLSDGTAGK